MKNTSNDNKIAKNLLRDFNNTETIISNTSNIFKRQKINGETTNKTNSNKRDDLEHI